MSLSRFVSIAMFEVLVFASWSVDAEISATPGAVFQECEECPEMVVIPPGSFTQGFDGGLEERYEGPRREVAIEYAFAIGRFEITQAQYAAFIQRSGFKPSVGCFMWDGAKAPFLDKHGWVDPGYGRPVADDEPVACLNWTHVNAYVTWLAEYTGKPYRLISESEWEYAARAGRDSDFTYTWGEDEAAACAAGNVYDERAAASRPDLSLPNAPCDDGYAGLAPVGQFAPNPFGVYDMTGNVWEWLADCYEMPYADAAPVDGSVYLSGTCDRRGVRGGSWLSTMFWQRPTFRGRDPEDLTSRIFGLRVARDLPEAVSP